jgi:ribosomal protein S18 acetylase RimI-like enzyme
VIEQCEFNDILPYWTNELWPDRKSVIEPFSCIDINGEIDIEIMKIAKPVFFKFMQDQETIGVVSAQNTDLNAIRLRGVWVNPAHRNQGVGLKLARAVTDYAVQKNVQSVWTMARVINLNFYEKCGFKATKKN